MNRRFAESFASLQNQLEGTESFWLGITGPPAAGKSTLSRYLCEQFGDSSVTIPMDGYHYYLSELDQMSDAELAHRRRGAPFTFNAAKFVKDLCLAKANGYGEFPSFDHLIGDPIENAIRYNAAKHKLVIVEGNYLLLPDEPWCHLTGIFDSTWFLDTPLETIRRRIIDRFVGTGLSPTAAQARAVENDIPNAQLVLQYSARADQLIAE